MPTGLPDWTVPVGIAAQLIDRLAVDIAAQSIGSIKVDIAAQSVAELKVNVTNSVLNVNLTGSEVTLDVNVTNSSLDVNIVGQVGNIDVNIANASPTVELNVNIRGSTVTLNINVESQSIGVKDEAQFAVEQGYNKVMSAWSDVAAGSSAVVIQYTVPSGKTLYIRKITCGCDTPPCEMVVRLYNASLGEDYIWLTEHYGADIDLDPPLPIEGGDEVWVWVYNRGSADNRYLCALLGWEK